MMFKLATLGISLAAFTIVVHAVGTTAWLRHLMRRTSPPGKSQSRLSIRTLIETGVVLILLHLVQVAAWAFTYKTMIPSGELANYEEAIYFSLVTFTTLGFGDITLSEGWRVLSGIQAMNGILLIGWSTAILFAIVQRIWDTNPGSHQ